MRAHPSRKRGWAATMEAAAGRAAPSGWANARQGVSQFGGLGIEHRLGGAVGEGDVGHDAEPTPSMPASRRGRGRVAVTAVVGFPAQGRGRGFGRRRPCAPQHRGGP